MGLFDLPSSALTWIDQQLLGFLPSVARLILWGVVAGVASMLLYKILSPQRALAACKARAAELKEKLNNYDGELSGMWRIAGPLLGTSLRQVGLAATPAVAASVPLLFLLVWVSNEYGYRYPDPGEPVRAEAASGAQVRLVAPDPAPVGSETPPRVVVSDDLGRTVADVELRQPVPVIHKRQWWNALIGNPAGYLPEDAAVDRVEIALPQVEVVSLGPDWLRGWEVVFFASLVLASVGLKFAARIE